MIELLPNIFNVFVSYSSDDDKQMRILDRLYDVYNTNEFIKIIDVSQNYSNADDSLCFNILSQIKQSNLFICILTPILKNDSYILNNNVILELGTAF